MSNSATNTTSVSYETWRQRVETDLKGASFDKRLVVKTPEGISIQPLYRKEDVSNLGANPVLLRVRQPNGEWTWKPLSKPELCRCKDNAVDPVGALLATGELKQSYEDNIKEMANRVQAAPEGLRPVSVGAMMVHEAGGTAVQELAFALATSLQYIRDLSAQGLAIEKILQGMQSEFALGVDFFMELSKIRAYRLMWAQMTSSLGLAQPDVAFIGCRTAMFDKTIFDNHVNLLRITTQAMSAVVGGCDTLYIRAFDSVLGKSSELGERMSRNLHEMLADEFLLSKVIDPAGGSYYIEKLTAELAENAWKLFQDIESQGGMLACVRSGYVQKLVEIAAEEKRKLIDSRRRVFLGTTLQPNLKEEVLPPAEDSETTCSADVPAAEKAQALKRWRGAEAFEAIRFAGDAYARQNGGKRVSVFLARMGVPKQYKARADFATGFLTPGGFEIAKGEAGFKTAEEAAEAAVKSGAAITVLCSTDDTYPELAPVFAKKVKELAPKMIVLLAGAPGENEVAWRAAGFDDFINVRSNVRNTLIQLQRLTGVIA